MLNAYFEPLYHPNKEEPNWKLLCNCNGDDQN